MKSSRNFFGLGALVFAVALGLTATALAQDQASYYEEQFKLIRAPYAVKSLADSPFGESINLYNGRLQFSHIDVSIPGNSTLPVSIGRRITTGESLLDGRAFGRWDLEIPHIHGTFSRLKGWLANDGTQRRCSSFGAPPLVVSGPITSYWDGTEYWQGTFLYVPGHGEQQMLSRSAENNLSPGTRDAYPVVTAKFWSISCISALNNPGGEGFLAKAPDGTQYRFDWMVKYRAPTLHKSQPESNTGVIDPKGTRNPTRRAPVPEDFEVNADSGYKLERDEVWLLPTEIKDRYGNTVSYTYDPSKPRNLQRISSSDGRMITLTHIAADDGLGDMVKTVYDGTRTWTYGYQRDSATLKTNLVSVQLPDGTYWNLSNFSPLLNQVSLLNNGGCYQQPALRSSAAVSGTMVHPAGAVATYTLAPVIHGRSRIHDDCADGSTTLSVPRYFATMSLVGKTVRGPGLPSMSWTYDYGASNESWDSCPTCITTKTVTETNPASQVTRYTFGNGYNLNEGRLELTEVSANAGSYPVRSIAQHYRPFGAGPYPNFAGFADDGNVGDSDFAARLAPLDRKQITQQGVTFTWEAQTFDTFARPLTVRRYSSLGSRTEKTEYFDHVSKWILGQIKSVTETASNKVMILNAYDLNTATLSSVTKFGRLDQVMTYYADGTLLSRKDPLNPATQFANYKRGIPQTVTYPNGAVERAVVNNIGNIDSMTDALGATTAFRYDAMGRLAVVVYPAGDTVNWEPTWIAFQPSGQGIYDLPPGHWRQTVTTGNAVAVTFFDALWRPAYVLKYDASDPSNSSRLVKRSYDHAGRTTYESYPKRVYEQIGDGVYHEYDALGRPTVTGTISELGTLFSGYSYGSNFRTVYSDAKHNDTYYSYQAFDDPTDTAITNISYPEGVSVAISRDNFGNTLSITRAGGGKSARRSYVYDANMRLCKTIEPETAATIIDYDAANNVAWRAPGLNYLSTTSCDRTSVASSGKITYKYDPLNRPSMTTYPDGSPGVAPTYYANGLLQTMGSGISHWSYGYNRRGLLETEQLSYGGKTYTLKRSYDQHGNLSRLTYPDGAAVDLAPNALGEPARVGNYANAIRYYPTGAVASFTYGNGITHAMTPNVRGLPQRTIDAGVINDAYTYDANGNVQSITDAQLNSANRTMAYDNLDRLRSVSAPNLWGTATYTYDALDNLTSSTVSAGAKARTMTHTYDAATNRLASLTGTAAYSATFGYDPRGNITRRGAQVFAFDYANRMRSATGKGTYDYDGFGRRVSVVGADNVNRIQVYSRDAQLMFAGVSSLPVTSGVKYIYLGNHILAEVSAGGVQYNHTDGLGSPVARTDGNRAIVGGHTRYEPYGLIAAGPAGTLGFTGHVNATDVGLVYMQQRYYDPVAGRMLSVDPVSPDVESGDSYSRYAYTHNNPYRYVDPDGRESEPTPVVVVAAPRPKSLPPTTTPRAEPRDVPVDITQRLNDRPIETLHPECVLPGLRLVCEAATVGAGAGLAIKGIKGVRKKPGSLGQPKGTDALRRENEQARAVDKELGLPPGTTHREISGEGLSGYKEILQYMKDLGYGK